MTRRHELLTRVEGAGEVLLHLDGGLLAGAQVAMLDIPRGFEQLVLGRHFSEVPALVSRVCAICSAAHKVVAARALERALGVEVPPAAAALRELLLLGALIESHALHLFLLVWPDMFGCDSIAGMLRLQPEAAGAGLELRQFGRRMQEIAGGRGVHPPNIDVGGVFAWPAADELAGLREALETWQERWPALEMMFTTAGSYPLSQRVPARELVVIGDQLAVAGQQLVVERYAECLEEMRPAYTRASQYHLQGAPLLCGALARARQAGHGSEAGFGVFANCAAQAREIGAALAAAAAWSAEAEGNRLKTGVSTVAAGSGVAAIEAPRGLLLHAYRIDADGQVVEARIITPTAVNQLAMEAQLCADLLGEPADAELAGRAARIVRAFDPCISCAVHVVRREK